MDSPFTRILIHRTRRWIMTKSYSLDLRVRVIECVEEGSSRRAAGRRFSVSESFSIKLLDRWRRTGSVEPGRRGRRTGSGKLEPCRAFIIARVREKPDITMPELAAELEAQRQVTVTPAALSRFLCRAGYSFKKKL
jgi:transposase